MVREWTVAQRTFLVEKKMQGADLAQIGAEYVPVPYLELFWVRRSWVGPVYLVSFSCWGGPVPYLELFWVGPVKKTTLYKCPKLHFFQMVLLLYQRKQKCQRASCKMSSCTAAANVDKTRPNHF